MNEFSAINYTPSSCLSDVVDHIMTFLTRGWYYTSPEEFAMDFPNIQQSLEVDEDTLFEVTVTIKPRYKFRQDVIISDVDKENYTAD